MLFCNDIEKSPPNLQVAEKEMMYKEGVKLK